MIDMIENVRYVVTKASKYNEFQVGDIIKLMPDGSINNYNALGWMPKEHVEKATKGIRVRIWGADCESNDDCS